MSYGDDLEDDLVYAVDDAPETVVSDEEFESGELQEDSKAPMKRGIESEEDNVKPVSAGEAAEYSSEKPVSKRQKKLANSKLHQKKLERMEYEKEQKKKLPKSSTDQIVEYLATVIREKNPNLSALELDEIYFKKTDFISTSKFEKERTLDNLQEFINNFSKSPKAIILSASNIRVADVYRNVNGTENAVKLFSKNKLQDDVNKIQEILGSSKSSKNDKSNKASKKNSKKSKIDAKSTKNVKYFLATPARMQKIIEQNDLLFQGKEKLDIFVDASYLDPKNNTIFTSDDSAALLKVLKEFLTKKSSVKVLLF